MNIATITSLSEMGFVGSSCPITNERAPNVTKSYGDIELSYNARSAYYGCDTTAIVIGGRVFFVLNGQHSQALDAALTAKGAQGMVEYFIEHLAHANFTSEHLMATGLANDLFGLMPTALEIIGQSNIDLIKQTAQQMGSGNVQRG